MSAKGFLLAAPLAASLFVLVHSAEAGNLTRVWVSSNGVDSGSCGPIASPCRTLNGGLSAATAGAEIDIQDAGAFGPGPITITQSVSIVNNGSGTAALQAASGNNVFLISAGPTDSVLISGFSVDGGGVALNGVEFDSGGSLTITNCTFRDFTRNGVLIKPTTGGQFVMSNSIASNNGFAGVYYDPPSGSGVAQIAINGTSTNNNLYGVALNSSAATGGFNATIANSIANNNSTDGMYFHGSGAANSVVAVDLSYANSNGGAGINNFSGATVLLSRSFATQNNYGVFANGTVYSYGDNRINNNVTDVNGTLNTTYVAR